MRCFSICTLFFCIISLTSAVPVPVPVPVPGTGPNDPKRPVDPSAPPSRPHTPTPENDPSVPLPGRTGTHTDTRTGVVTMYYGDDHLPEHMGHLQRNQAEFPHNRHPNPLSGPSEQNRKHALHNIPEAVRHPVTGLPRVRDEKLPNMLHSPHHATSTTVEYLPKKESNKEGGHLRGFKGAIKKAGPNAQGQLRPNPGWLPLHPDQRRGHEAPARLNTQHRADGTPFTQPVPSTRRPPPPPPMPPKVHQQPPKGTNNLRPGRVAPPGHVWHPLPTNGVRPTHFGAPGHLNEAAKRHPPRPQNHQHYTQQLQAAQAAEAKHKAAASGAHKGPSKYLPAQTPNLKKFEQQFPARHGGASGRAHEAPARMQTHVNHSPSNSAPHTRPPSPQGHQSRPSSPHSPSHSAPRTRPPSAQGHQSRPSSSHPQNLPHGSKPKGGPPRKK